MTKISALSDIGTSVASDDAFVLVDVSDPTTPNKKIQQQNLFLIPDGSVGTPGLRFLNDIDTGIFRNGSNTLGLVTGGSSRLYIDSSGRVGIGTTSPLARLTVSTSNENFEFTPASTTYNGGLFEYLNRGTNTTRPDLNYYLGSTTGGSHKFWTDGTERARIDSLGRLLVGTSSLSTDLATIAVFQGYKGSPTSEGIIYISRGSAPGTNDDIGSIRFSANNHTLAAMVACNRDGGTWTAGSSQPTRLTFSTTSDGASSLTERMRITSTGEVQIAYALWNKGSMYLGPTGADSTRFFTSSTGSSSTTMYIGNAAIQVSSDIRLKENVVDTVVDASAELKKVRIVDYTWNDPTDTSYNNRNARGVWTGLIAQELIDVFPFAVNAPRKEDDLSVDHDSEDLWTVDQDQLVPVLIKGFQQALARIETLEAKVAALESA